MDSRQLDRLTRALAGVGSRRVLLGLLAFLPSLGGRAGPAAEIAAARRRTRRKKRISVAGPCGNGSLKTNRCKRHDQCCTGFCHKRKRCRCLSAGQACTEDRNCCPESMGRTCQDGSCQPLPPCSARCAGCCDGEQCQPGHQPAACGVAGERCQVCAAHERCWNGACACGDVCASGCQFTSLQEAIDAASSVATLRLCAETYEESIEISQALTLIGRGDGDDGTTLRGGDRGTEVVYILGSPVVLEGVRITGGKNPSTTGGILIATSRHVTLTNSTVTGNVGTSTGGIYNDGKLTLNGSVVAGNSGSFGGGISNDEHGTVILNDSTVSENESSGCCGGIRNEGTVNLVNSAVANNTAGTSGGGISNTGSLFLTTSQVSENTAGTVSGGIYSKDSTVTLTDSDVTNNTATAQGGGIYSNNSTVALADSTVSDNEPDNCAGDPVVGCSG
jgi:predicted outer membrane repeat protein